MSSKLSPAGKAVRDQIVNRILKGLADPAAPGCYDEKRLARILKIAEGTTTVKARRQHFSARIGVKIYGNSARELQEAKTRAEALTGPSDHGYMYRLWWDPKSNYVRLVAYKIVSRSKQSAVMRYGPAPGECRRVYHNRPSAYAHLDLDQAVYAFRQRRRSYARILRSKYDEIGPSIRAVTIDEMEIIGLKQEYTFHGEEFST